MVDSLLASFGLYGATFVIAFVAGTFPIISIEVFLMGATALGVEASMLVVLIGIAVVGHQIAKALTYYAGAGAFELPRDKTRERIERSVMSHLNLDLQREDAARLDALSKCARIRA